MKLSHLFVLSAAAVVPAGALGADPQVDLRTNLGTIRLELYPAAAPKTVENFLQYVKDGQYNGPAAAAWAEAGDFDDFHYVNELHTWKGGVSVSGSTEHVLHEFLMPWRVDD